MSTLQTNTRPGSPSNKIASHESGVTVSYFDIPGRGFPIRVSLFNAFGKDGFTDDRISQDDWPSRKKDTPLGSIPILTLKDGTQMTQTDAILRWAGNQKGQHATLYPTDPNLQMKVDEINTILGDILVWGQFKKYGLPTEDEQNKALHQYISKPDGACWKQFDLIEKRLGDKKFVVGDELTTADLHLVGLISLMEDTPLLEPIPRTYIKDTFPMLHSHFNRVMAHPLVKEFMKHFPNK